MTGALVLLNPRAAGGGAGRLAADVRELTEHSGAGHRFVAPDSVDEALALVRTLPPGTRVVLCGGDGTVHRMLPALMECKHLLGLVPCGSGNDLARALGYPLGDLRGALAHALEAPAVAVDTGELHFAGQCRPFASSVAAGFDASVGLRALDGPRWLTGLPRYLWATAMELKALRRYRINVSVDNAPWSGGEVLFASVLNTPSYGSGMPAVPHARIEDGRLDLLVAGRFDRLGTLWMLPRLLAGKHLGDSRVKTTPFQLLSARAEQAVPLAVDGEVAGAAAEWQVVVKPLSLRVVGRPRGTG
ncbi:MAG: hypothetical protein RL087_202 [Pseudomonadota bacterium]